MDFSDPRWAGLTGGYRSLYDPRPALRTLRAGDAAQAWAELWNELHHQDDVGTASFAALPVLVQTHAERGVADWNTYALCGTIELCRRHEDNPPIPAWLVDGYRGAWDALQQLAQRDFVAASAPELVDSILAVFAIGKGRHLLARCALDLTEDERAEILDGAKTEWVGHSTPLAPCKERPYSDAS